MSQYTDAIEHNLKGCNFVSTGPCRGCEDCKDFSEDVGDEGSFSWRSCGVCGTSLGGDRYVWHWVDENNEIVHEDDCCQDCVMYLAYGDEPEIDE